MNRLTGEALPWQYNLPIVGHTIRHERESQAA
jgi:hypothetical protein